MSDDDLLAITRDHEKHLGERPSWTCRVCGDQWPCASARRQLRIEFRWFPSVFRIYMMALMSDAAADLEPDTPGPSTALYDRFLSWLPIPAQPRRH
jgi:hypothetical protein